MEEQEWVQRIDRPIAFRARKTSRDYAWRGLDAVLWDASDGYSAQVGHFNSNGVGEFYADDTWKGTPVIVRDRWARNENGHPHFEQAFSSDGGNTWEVNWISDQTPIADSRLR